MTSDYTLKQKAKHKKHRKKSKHKKQKSERKDTREISSTCDPKSSGSNQTASDDEQVNADILSLAQSIAETSTLLDSAGELSDLDVLKTPVKLRRPLGKVTQNKPQQFLDFTTLPYSCKTSDTKERPISSSDFSFNNPVSEAAITEVNAKKNNQSDFIIPSIGSLGFKSGQTKIAKLDTMSDSDSDSSSDEDHEIGSPNSSQANSNKSSNAHTMSDSGSESDAADVPTPSASPRKKTNGSTKNISDGFVAKLFPEVPEGMTDHSFTTQNAPCWLEDVKDGNKELWFIKVPHDFEPEHLTGVELGNDTVTLPSQNTEKCYEVRTSKAGEEMSRMNVLLPSKKKQKLCLAPSLARYFDVVETLPAKTVSTPSPSRPRNMTLPEGLKYRLAPFGGDSPEEIMEMDSPERKPSKRKSDKKISISSEMSPKRIKMSKINGVENVASPSMHGDLDSSRTSKKSKKKNKDKPFEDQAETVVVKQEPMNTGDDSQAHKKKKKKGKEESTGKMSVGIKLEPADSSNDEINASTKKKKKRKEESSGAPSVGVKLEPLESSDDEFNSPKKEKKKKKKDRLDMSVVNIKKKKDNEQICQTIRVNSAKKHKKPHEKSIDEDVANESLSSEKKAKKKHKQKDGMVNIKLEVADDDPRDETLKKIKKKHKKKLTHVK